MTESDRFHALMRAYRHVNNRTYAIFAAAALANFLVWAGGRLLLARGVIGPPAVTIIAGLVVIVSCLLLIGFTAVLLTAADRVGGQYT